MLHIWTSYITIKRNYVRILYKNKPTAYIHKETKYKKLLKIEDKFPSVDEIWVYKICTHHGLGIYGIYVSNDILSWKVPRYSKKNVYLK
jgi:hypothetical protein